MTSAIPPELLEAYRRTRYRVDADPPFHLRVDVASPSLAALMARAGVRSAAFVTAWNPCSEVISDEENRRAQAKLHAEIETLGCAIIPGFGEWENAPESGEPSVLVLGIGEASARELGRRYRQHAILFAEDDAVPRLIAT
jgi:hypothetical protein